MAGHNVLSCPVSQPADRVAAKGRRRRRPSSTHALFLSLAVHLPVCFCLRPRWKMLGLICRQANLLASSQKWVSSWGDATRHVEAVSFPASSSCPLPVVVVSGRWYRLYGIVIARLSPSLWSRISCALPFERKRVWFISRGSRSRIVPLSSAYALRRVCIPCEEIIIIICWWCVISVTTTCPKKFVRIPRRRKLMDSSRTENYENVEKWDVSRNAGESFHFPVISTLLTFCSTWDSCLFRKIYKFRNTIDYLSSIARVDDIPLLLQPRLLTETQLWAMVMAYPRARWCHEVVI